METQKYYTPTIEEFHYGFEYEMEVKDFHNNVFIGNKWEKFTLYSEDLNEIQSKIIDKIIRVKCLDEDDIYDLGWVNRSGYYEYYLKNYYKRENVTARLFYEDVFFNKKRILSIEVGGTGLRADEFSCVYYGSVNNKSELKKVMQMLGIIE